MIDGPPARREFLASALLLLTGCASGGTGGGRSSPNQISREDLDRVETLSAYEAIQRIRPRWLQSRGPTGIGRPPALPRVHVNQSPMPLEVLRTLPVSEIESMRFLSASDATTRYGTGYPAGLIEVRTRS